MTSPPPLRTAVVGYGLAGEVFHCPLVAAAPGLALTTIVTSDAGRAAAAAARYPSARIVPSADALWSGPDRPELVVVGAVNRAHVPLALAAIEAGCAVVVDKPIAVQADDGQRIVDAAERAGVPLAVFQNRRWDAEFLTAAALVRSGRLGTVLRFESRFERWRPLPKSDAWRESSDPADGGGLLLDLGSHLADQAVQLLGPVRRVYAEVDVRRDGAIVDDDTFLALEHTSGARSHLWVSATAAHLGPRFRILGTEAAYVHDDLDRQEDVLRAGGGPGDEGYGVVPPERWGRLVIGDQVVAVPCERGRWDAFYPAMAAAVRGEGPVPVPGAEAVAILRVLDAARESAQTGTIVTVG